MFFKGMISLMPILIGIIVGYIYSAFIGILGFYKSTGSKDV